MWVTDYSYTRLHSPYLFSVIFFHPWEKKPNLIWLFIMLNDMCQGVGMQAHILGGPHCDVVAVYIETVTTKVGTFAPGENFQEEVWVGYKWLCSSLSPSLQLDVLNCISLSHRYMKYPEIQPLCWPQEIHFPAFNCKRKTQSEHVPLILIV